MMNHCLRALLSYDGHQHVLSSLRKVRCPLQRRLVLR